MQEAIAKKENTREQYQFKESEIKRKLKWKKRNFPELIKQKQSFPPEPPFLHGKTLCYNENSSEVH